MMDFEWKPSVETVLRCISTFSGLAGYLYKPQHLQGDYLKAVPERKTTKLPRSHPPLLNVFWNQFHVFLWICWPHLPWLNSIPVWLTAPIYKRSKLLAMSLFLILRSWCSNLWHNAVPYYNISSPCLFEAPYNRNHWYYHFLSLVAGSHWRHL